MQNNNNIKLSEFEIFQALSGNFICKTIPDNWQELNDEEQDEFIQKHIWQPLEYSDSSRILELIDNSTSTMIEFLKGKGIEVSD
ncbi:MAG: hypothetical protein QNJ32_28120 [Xenococcaceae cyanobacterium MO_167.B27]|nr:hypothetical protein [Xenococcaceae cyanobacterium MO_167.B27]